MEFITLLILLQGRGAHLVATLKAPPSLNKALLLPPFFLGKQLWDVAPSCSSLFLGLACLVHVSPWCSGDCFFLHSGVLFLV